MANDDNKGSESGAKIHEWFTTISKMLELSANTIGEMEMTKFTNEIGEVMLGLRQIDFDKLQAATNLIVMSHETIPNLYEYILDSVTNVRREDTIELIKVFVALVPSWIAEKPTASQVINDIAKNINLPKDTRLDLLPRFEWGRQVYDNLGNELPKREQRH